MSFFELQPSLKDRPYRLEKAQGKFEKKELLIVDIKKEATIGRDHGRKRTKAGKSRLSHESITFL